MVTIEGQQYSFKGFWDSCFFTRNNNESGVILTNLKTGKDEFFSYNELRKLEKSRCQNDNDSKNKDNYYK